MTKRLIEFNCGDPKSNQQTASKVDCNIVINNSQHYEPKQDGRNRRDVSVIENVEVYDDHVYQRDSARNSQQFTGERNTSVNEDGANCNGSTFNSKVTIPVNMRPIQIPATTERYVVVSRQPIVTSEEIDSNIEFHKKRADIMTRILCMDNKKLLANLIDKSGKVILSAQEFCELVACMLSTEAYPYLPSDINLTLQEEVNTSCLKSVVSPFKHVISIKINNQDFYNVQNEAYNILTNNYKVSVETVYVPPSIPL